MQFDDPGNIGSTSGDANSIDFERMDLPELLDVLEDNEYDISLKLKIRPDPVNAQKIQTFLIENCKSTIIEMGFTCYENFPDSGFSALIFLPDSPVILSLYDYNRLLLGIFGRIKDYEEQGMTVKCLNIGLLSASFYRNGGCIRTEIGGLSLDQINYYTDDDSFQGIRQFYTRLKVLPSR